MRLNCEQVEDRTVPTAYFVKLDSPTTGDPFLSHPTATVSGFLDLNAAYPSVTNGGIVVDAASATDAVRQGLFGRIGVRSQANGQPVALFHDYKPATVGTTAAAQLPFRVQWAGVPYVTTEYKVGLEDLATTNLADWDYDDLVWLVQADDGTSPPPPPNTVGNTPPPVSGPRVEFVNPQGQGMTDGKVAKWQNAYEVAGGKVKVKDNFPATDADRFFIRVTDQYYAQNPGETPKPIQLRTDSDLGNGLTLHPVTAGGFAGVYYSDPCVLVSNTVDDMFPVNGIPDNGLDDTTFKVRLGDTITIDYDSNPESGGGGRPIIHKRVPVRVLKEVKVHVTVMTVADANGYRAPVTSPAQVDTWLTEANETYAQAGVRLVWGEVQFADEPAATQPTDEDVNLSDGLSDPVTQKKEARGLIRGNRTAGGVTAPIRTPADDDVELFFINYFSVPDEVPDGNGGTKIIYIEDRDFRGQSFPAYSYSTTPNDSDLVDSVIVSANNLDAFTVAHEIGHILTDAGHVAEVGGLVRTQVEPNLMRAGEEDKIEQQDEIIVPDSNDPRYPDWLTASKRLTDDQQWAVWTKRQAIVKDYIP